MESHRMTDTPNHENDRRDRSRRAADACPHYDACSAVSKTLEDIKEGINLLKAAFPGEDFEGHHSYHDAAIKAKQAEERFWTELKMELTVSGIKGLLIVISGLVMTGIAFEIREWFK